MKRMTKKMATLAVVTMLLTAAEAGAVPILVSEWAGPSGLAAEDASVAAQIVAYNGANNPDLPLLGGLTKGVSQQTTSLTDFGTDSNVLNWTAPTDCDFYYIMTKWGQGTANWDHALHYVLAGESIVNYNPGGSAAPRGLSHVSIWCGDTPSVPDAGSSLTLLSLAGLGLAAVKRMRS